MRYSNYGVGIVSCIACNSFNRHLFLERLNMDKEETIIEWPARQHETGDYQGDPPVGERFEHNGVTYHTGWMLSKPGKDSFGMWINEQPNGGFKWEFLDYKPADEENYRKVYIVAEDPRSE